MSKNPSLGKHLTRDDRIRIETYLKQGFSIRYIAERLDKSPSTISREIKNHTLITKSNSCDCEFFFECKMHHVCEKNTQNCRKDCRTCAKAKKYCSDYTKVYCDYQIERKISLCNGCSKIYNCHFPKYIYKGKEADDKYRDVLINSRNGFDLTCEQLDYIDKTVSPLIKQGQSVYHIVSSNDLPVCESTLRRLINNCELDARNIDLRNAVKRRQRRKRPAGYNTMTVIKDGHKYEDFLKYMDTHETAVVQMDCVEGTKTDNAALLTLYFSTSHLQLAIVLNEHTSKYVIEALDMIEDILGKDLFAQIFPIILTDNGHEFADINGIERSVFGGKRTKVFYCEPNHPEQKGGCEKNHELIRYVIPKGTSLESYSQEQINLMMNHINNYKRKELFGHSPYDIAKQLYPEDFLILLGIEYVEPNEINLTPALMKIASD